MKTIIFDIDNTLADQTERETKATCVDLMGNKKLNWDIFEQENLVANDKPMPQTIELCKLLSKKYKIIIVTARKIKLGDITEKWLNDQGIEHDGIYFRNNDDFRPDVEFKESLYNQTLKDKYDIHMVFDDRPKIIKMWKSKGLYVFECNNLKGDW